jgi:hypothetical protein
MGKLARDHELNVVEKAANCLIRSVRYTLRMSAFPSASSQMATTVSFSPQIGNISLLLHIM